VVIPGVGMFAVGALIFLLAAMRVAFEPGEVWASRAGRTTVSEPAAEGSTAAIVAAYSRALESRGS